MEQRAVGHAGSVRLAPRPHQQAREDERHLGSLEFARQRQALSDGAALGPEFLGYLRSQAMVECARNPGCTMVVAPEGTGVNVISPGAPGA
ncbi:MAG: hypothetical protein KY450_07810 [Actinobacteria bacterium]|nr:hypothetical protein [Actinomycetota bacterium]